MRLQYFERWGPELDAALQAIPEAEHCPHELLKLLQTTPSSARKRTVLATDNGRPVAVLPLRQAGWVWEPVTQWLVPGQPLPVADGHIEGLLRRMNLPFYVTWWRRQPVRPVVRMAQTVKRQVTYGTPLDADFEAYWRRTGAHRSVRRGRRRCAPFALSIDAPGSAEWIIHGWGRRWYAHGSSDGPALRDRIAAAEYFAATGKLHTFLLKDGSLPIGGEIVFEHEQDLVWLVSHRESAYDWHGVGNCLMDAVFHWARDQGYRAIDLGAGHAYKARWAPPAGERVDCFIAPRRSLRSIAGSALRRLGRTVGPARALVGR